MTIAIYFVAILAGLTAVGAGLGWVTVASAITIIGLLLSGGVAGVHYMVQKNYAVKKGCC